jgi:transcriptional regulator with XRE-family HTH domain
MNNNINSENDDLSVNVGRCLRELRAARGLSIRALAEQSGLNVNTISLIENGKTSPSVSTLQQIANALKLPINAFFQTQPPPLSIVYQKAGDRQEAAIAHGTLADLGSGFTHMGLELLLVNIEPQANSGKRLIVHTGVELVYCLDGCLCYEVDGEPFTLEAGDSLLFEAHLPHRWSNPGELSSQLLVLAFPADERERADERHFALKI